MEPFKNLLGEKAIKKIAAELKKNDPTLNLKQFLKNIEKDIEPLELKERSKFISKKCAEYLPSDIYKSFPLLLKTLKSTKNPNGLEGFLVWPLTHFVETYGCEDTEYALSALKEMTKVFTGEFAIRSFLIRDEKKTLSILKSWLDDKDDHVRRLITEGTRPMLPWGQKIPAFIENPNLTYLFLDHLKLDSSDYVLKSIANHLNDHSKNNADWLIQKCTEWKSKNPSHPKLQKLIKHALRTLIKKGDPHALELVVISTVKWGEIHTEISSKQLNLGDFFKASLTLKNPKKTPLAVIIDHEFSFLKQNNKWSKKVFKGIKLELKPGEKKTIPLRLRLKPVTTRKYYAGLQHWNVIVNGTKTKPQAFKLTT